MMSTIRNKYWYILPLIFTPCAAGMAYAIEYLGNLVSGQSLAPWLLIGIVWCICWLIFALCGAGLIFWGVGLICRIIAMVLPAHVRPNYWIKTSFAVEGQEYVVKDSDGDLFIATYNGKDYIYQNHYAVEDVTEIMVVE